MNNDSIFVRIFVAVVSGVIVALVVGAILPGNKDVDENATVCSIGFYSCPLVQTMKKNVPCFCYGVYGTFPGVTR